MAEMDAYRTSDKRRITAVLNHERPDRVPNFEVLVENPTLTHVMGRAVPYSHTLDNIPPADYAEFARRVGQDVIGMCFFSSPFRFDSPIRSRADFARVQMVGVESQASRLLQLDAYARTVQGTELGLFVLLGSFLCDTYTSVFGFENFMCMLYDDRDLVEEVLELYTRYYVELAGRLVRYPLTFFYIGDDVAFKSGTLMDPKMLRELWLPRMRRIFAPAREAGIPILFHSDGNIEALLPDLIEMGAAAINPIEPYGMDIRAIHRRYGRNLALVGNLDVGGALSTGSPDDVRREARRLIDDCGRDGGLVLASSHSITGNVKPANFLAMCETAQTYGRL
jgi:uroporphyrinogen decarboxylase